VDDDGFFTGAEGLLGKSGRTIHEGLELFIGVAFDGGEADRGHQVREGVPWDELVVVDPALSLGTRRYGDGSMRVYASIT
jgi:hypothetical protein